MLEVTVKTLDSQNHSFSVPDDITVKEFKEKISPVLNISVEKQRLIFCGKVLKDEKNLNEYDVNGKVIHVVQSLPPQGNNTSPSASSANSPAGGSRTGGHRDAAGFLLGAFTIPQDLIDPTQVQNIVQDVVSGMGEIGRNATVMSRTSEDGSSVDVHINLGQVPLQSEAQLRMNRVQTMLLRANRLLESLEDGTGSNNGVVVDSSSQTDNESEEVRNSPMEIESENSAVPDNDITNGTSEDSSLHNETNIDDSSGLPSEVNVTTETSGRTPVASERYRFEGLAHAAQAAISAALATAAAAARAATATVTTPIIADTGNINNMRSIDPEPMDSDSSEFRIPRSENSTSMTSEIGSDVGGLPSVPAQPVSASNEQNQQSSNGTHPESASINQGTQNSGTSAPARREVMPSVQTLANLLDEVIRVNTRLEPCLERCRDLIRSDPPLSGRQLNDAHRLFSRISQLLHFLSHAFHSLSDLHINFSQAPPRSPRVRIISSHSSSVLHGIPVQAQISISTSSNVISSPNQSTTTTASNSNDTIQNSTTEARPAPRVVNQIPISTPLSSSSTSSAGPAMSNVLRNQNPVVFMEVSPGTITIDSISAMESPLSGNEANRTPQPMAASNRDNSAAPQNEPSSANTARGPIPNVSVPPFSGQGHPMINIPFRNLIPVPLTSMGSLHAFDSGLPCHSVWALEPSRRRHNAGGSRTPAAVQIGVTPNVPGRQEDQLQQVINNIMMSLLNHPNVPPQGNQATPGFTLFSSSIDDAQRRRFFMDAVATQRNRDNSARTESSGSQLNGSTESFTIPLTSSALIDDDTFISLLHVLTETTDGSGLRHPTIAEEFAGFFNDGVDIDEGGIVGKLLWFLAGQLSFKDVFDIYMGNAEPLNKIKEALQAYIREKVYDEDRDSNDKITTLTSQILNECALLQVLESRVDVHESIDYNDELIAFVKKVVRQLLNAILKPSDNSSISFGQNLRNVCLELFQDFLSLNNRCTENGNSVAETVILEAVEGLCEGTTQRLSLIIPTLASRIARDCFRSSSRPQSNNDAAKSHVSSAATGSASLEEKISSVGGNLSSDCSSKQTKRNMTSSEKNSSYNKKGKESLSSGISENRVSPTLPLLARLEERTSALLRNANHGLTEVVIGSEAWHNTMPRDWVPIITRDVQRQRRQAPQAPFSNAYLSGMPSKRRKIMTNGSPILLGQSQSALSDMLFQAISNANVQPLHNIEEVKKDASQDILLQSAFNEHMKNSIQERLHRDLDYCSERFPNAEKYFNID